MALYLKQAIFVNRAPFEHVELNFKKDGVNVLSAINGKGKTTILSHIVDAFFELAKPHYPNEFEDKPNKYYRVSSSTFNLDMTKASYVYLRFVCQDETNEEYWDYLDIRNMCTEEEYNNQIRLVDKIPYNHFSRNLEKEGNKKLWSRITSEQKVHKIFDNNFLTYFPSYRYETPGYLNEPYRFKIEHKIDSRFSGYLPNPLESYCLFKDIANWLLDVELDNVEQILEINNLGQKLMPYLNENPMDIAQAVRTNPDVSQVVRRLQNNVQYLQSSIVANVNTVFSHALSSKYSEPLKLNIGSRALGGIRINVAKTNNEVIYPSIFNMSSGEKAVISIFVELLRQMDNLHIKIEDITGIVLIDEVDKNLHIKMQHDVLPKLFKLFPHVQFIVSSHSPFLNMGLADEMENKAQIIDLDNNGLICLPRNNDMYREVYEMMLHEKADYAQQVETLKQKIASITKPIILTEGKTDWKHIKHALKQLQEQGEYLDIDVVFDEYETDRGDAKLQSMSTALSQFPNSQKIIAIYDTDKDMVKLADGELFKRSGNNVYELPIPNPQGYGCGISIEMMYPEVDIKRVDVNGRRLFLTSEFNLKTGALLDGMKEKNCHNNALKDADKRGIIKIIDQEVYDVTSGIDCALSKEAYAMYILKENEAYRDVDISGFRMLFDTIRLIIHD